MQIVYILTTGGTLEKEYSEDTGHVANLSSKVDRYLHALRLPDCDVRIVPVLNKDSLEMTDSDRLLRLEHVKVLLQEQAPVVITHGTDTMVETGLYLDRALPDIAIPIVMTGAMRPLGFEGSDGLQNLTESLFAVRTLEPGIYLVMHGQTFPIHRARKDHARGRFVWTDPRLI